MEKGIGICYWDVIVVNKKHDLHGVDVQSVHALQIITLLTTGTLVWTT